MSLDDKKIKENQLNDEEMEQVSGGQTGLTTELWQKANQENPKPGTPKNANTIVGHTEIV